MMHEINKCWRCAPRRAESKLIRNKIRIDYIDLVLKYSFDSFSVSRTRLDYFVLRSFRSLSQLDLLTVIPFVKNCYTAARVSLSIQAISILHARQAVHIATILHIGHSSIEVFCSRIWCSRGREYIAICNWKANLHLETWCHTLQCIGRIQKYTFIRAKIYVIPCSLPVTGRHLWFIAHVYIGRYLHWFSHVAWPQA